MARKVHASDEESPKREPSAVARVRFGWCMSDLPMPHPACRVEFVSTQTKQHCICNCPCHEKE